MLRLHCQAEGSTVILSPSLTRATSLESVLSRRPVMSTSETPTNRPTKVRSSKTEPRFKVPVRTELDRSPSLDQVCNLRSSYCNGNCKVYLLNPYCIHVYYVKQSTNYIDIPGINIFTILESIRKFIISYCKIYSEIFEYVLQTHYFVGAF